MRTNKRNNNDENIEDIVTEIDCPHCAMVYKADNRDKKVMDMFHQVHWVSVHPEFFGEAEQVEENVFRCSSCFKYFVLDLMKMRTRPLKRMERKRIDPQARFHHRTMKFSQLEAAYIGLQRFSQITITGFDEELGILHFKDAYQNDCKVELAPMILKAFIVDTAADMRVKNSIIKAIRIEKDYSYNYRHEDELEENQIQMPGHECPECEKERHD